MAPTRKRPRLSGFSILDEYLHDDGPLEDSDCESDTEKLPRRRKSANIDREMETGHARIFADYFSDNPVFNEKLFRRRYRMPSAFLKGVISQLEAHDKYFTQRKDACGRNGASSIQNVTAALTRVKQPTK